MNIIDRPSPHQRERKAGSGSIRLIVWHGTAGTDAGDLQHLLNPDLTHPVSYHYHITRKGIITRLVRPERQAFHAGRSVWKGVPSVNNFSVGVGLSNLGDGEPFTPAQYRAAGWLGATLMRHYPIPLEGNVGHYHVSGKHLRVRDDPKTDPWEVFEWGQLFAEILAAQAAALPPPGR